ncbi:RNA polymerase factor sigma-54 [Paenibacillus hamazuiensis]|uniref:RNA polymerase factor sigma-54 n=1 Tax=Paenibacillus hamazuiensis TaxID=2936508 RepID=UPI00200F603E|nr:RNA polymerase factor sigma-54 [Paenibacillus hamazuiensis]
MISQQHFAQTQYMKQTAAPRLIQAMSILQMSSMELAHFVREQSLENPFLEVEFDGGTTYWYPGARSADRSAGATDTDGFIEWTAVQDETLESVLLSQLRINGITGVRFRLAAYLAGNLNESGLLDISLDEVCAHFHVPASEVEAALKDLQALEPAGVGARSLKECLEIQIIRDSAADEWAHPIVSRFLEELAGGKIQKIADRLGITGERVRRSIEYIRSLNPRPGYAYSRHTPRYIEPDAVVEKVNGRYVVKMSVSSMPKISVASYHSGLTSKSDLKAYQPYARQNLQTAQWLVRCVEQRKATLAKVIEAVVKEQSLFLERGASFLKPMNLRKIGDELRLDESTISRTVHHKYVQTSHGIFELKYFFDNGLATRSGTEASSESIKAKIRQVIDGENRLSPYSDRQITEMLVQDGIHISRRTVMKYREELRILSSKFRCRGS